MPGSNSGPMSDEMLFPGVAAQSYVLRWFALGMPLLLLVHHGQPYSELIPRCRKFDTLYESLTNNCKAYVPVYVSDIFIRVVSFQG